MNDGERATSSRVNSLKMSGASGPKESRKESSSSRPKPKPFLPPTFFQYLTSSSTSFA
jgi:hypothetical protein